MNLVYVGESPARQINVPGGVVLASHGEPFEVPDEVGASLLEQDVYELAGTTPEPSPTPEEPVEKEEV